LTEGGECYTQVIFITQFRATVGQK